jgi:hypothetical protein
MLRLTITSGASLDRRRIDLDRWQHVAFDLRNLAIAEAIPSIVVYASGQSSDAGCEHLLSSMKSDPGRGTNLRQVDDSAQ